MGCSTWSEESWKSPFDYQLTEKRNKKKEEINIHLFQLLQREDLLLYIVVN